MLKLKNIEDYVVVLKKPGALAVATDVDCCVIPFNSTLRAIYSRTGTAGVNGAGGSADVLIDLKKNGTSLMSTKVTFGFSSPSRDPSNNGVFSTDPPTFVKGDVISMDINQVFGGTSPTQPTNLAITLVLQRGRGSKVGSVIKGGVGPDVE